MLLPRLILIWNFAINSVYGLVFVPSDYIRTHSLPVSYAVRSFTAIVLVISPVAGFLADVQFGRYKTLQYSMWLILAVSSLFVFASLIFFITNISAVPKVTLIIAFGIAYLLGYYGYNANIIQYGLDQLRDAPSQDSVVFLHWYFWLYCCFS